MWSKRTWSAGCFKQTEWRVVPVRRTTRRGAWTACPVGHSRYWFKKATWIERATCWQEHADLGKCSGMTPERLTPVAAVGESRANARQPQRRTVQRLRAEADPTRPPS